MTTPERTNFLGLMPEALFIAILTAVAYWLTFLYEAEYLNAFGLPSQLVEVSLRTALSVALALSGIIWIFFLFTNLVLIFWPKHPAIREKVFRAGVMLLFPIWHLFNYGIRTQDWVIYITFFLFIVIFEFLWPFLAFREKPTLRERFIADEIQESEVRKRGVFGRLYTAFGPAMYSLVILVVLGSSLAQTAGRAKATTQKEFFVFASDPDTAVIRMYRDTILAVPFDRETKALQAQVVIRKIGTENVVLKLEADVGPLKPQEK